MISLSAVDGNAAAGESQAVIATVAAVASGLVPKCTDKGSRHVANSVLYIWEARLGGALDRAEMPFGAAPLYFKAASLSRPL